MDVFMLTLARVTLLMIFITLGYFLHRRNFLPEQTGRVLSLLCMLVFSPAYNFKSISSRFTMDVLTDKLVLLGAGLLLAIAVVIAGNLISKPLGKTDMERKSLKYAFIFSNYGYFGYPVIEGVFGAEMLGDFIIFMQPINFLCYTYGLMIFQEEAKRLKLTDFLKKPIIVAVILGAIWGLTGLTMPSILQSAIDTAAACQTPSCMLLAGFLLGKFPLKKLLTGKKTYLLCAIRLVGIPILFGILTWLLGVRGKLLFLSLLFTAMPLGLNLVVFPESLGYEEDAEKNAKLCFVSFLLSLITLPCIFALLTAICF